MLGAAVTTGTQRSPRAGRPTWGREEQGAFRPGRRCPRDGREGFLENRQELVFASPFARWLAGRGPDATAAPYMPSARVLRHLQPLSSSRAGGRPFAGIRCRHGRPGAADDAPLSSGTGSLPQQWDGPDEPRVRNLSRNGDINTSQDRTQRRNRDPAGTPVHPVAMPIASRSQPRLVAAA